MSMFIYRKGGANSKKMTQLESLLLKMFRRIDTMFLPVDKMLLHVSKLKKEVLAI